jgi:hypothetical protein
MLPRMRPLGDFSAHSLRYFQTGAVEKSRAANLLGDPSPEKR